MKSSKTLAILGIAAAMLSGSAAEPTQRVKETQILPNFQKDYVNYTKGGFNTGHRRSRGPMSLHKQKMQHKKYAKSKK